MLKRHLVEMRAKGIVFLVVIVLISINFHIFSARPVFANEEWKTYETNYCTIQYIDDEHLKRFTLRIGGIKYTSKGMNDNPSNINSRVNEIMKKVRSTLDMYPSDLRISIFLYPNYNSLGKIFRQSTLTGSVNTFTGSVPLAFYTHRTKSIHLDVESVTEGVLAHEMAHAVINFYFKSPPPAKMQEILAQYVDLHLWD